MQESPKDKLKRMTAWNVEPMLSEADLDGLLAQSSLADRSGVSPQEVEWSPTYDLNAAAASGWLIKAGRATRPQSAVPAPPTIPPAPSVPTPPAGGGIVPGAPTPPSGTVPTPPSVTVAFNSSKPMLYEQCLEMARIYAAKKRLTVATSMPTN